MAIPLQQSRSRPTSPHTGGGTIGARQESPSHRGFQSSINHSPITSVGPTYVLSICAATATRATHRDRRELSPKLIVQGTFGHQAVSATCAKPKDLQLSPSTVLTLAYALTYQSPYAGFTVVCGAPHTRWVHPGMDTVLSCITAVAQTQQVCSVR